MWVSTFLCWFVALNFGVLRAFFQREEQIEFLVVRAMLILSFEYELQHIRDEALRRLRIWCPSTLAGYDRFHQLAWQDSNFMPPCVADSVTIINMSRKFDLPEFLPYVFFQCSSMPLHRLLKPVHYDSCIEVLAGLDYMEEEARVQTRTICCQIPADDCQSKTACKQIVQHIPGKLLLYGDMFSRRRFFTALEPVIDQELTLLSADTKRLPLCSTCHDMLREKVRSYREHAWELSSTFFDV